MIDFIYFYLQPVSLAFIGSAPALVMSFVLIDLIKRNNRE